MDSPGSSISSLSASEATRLLKDLLNVGKQHSPDSDDSRSVHTSNNTAITSKSSKSNGEHHVNEAGDTLSSTQSSSQFTLSKMMADNGQPLTRQQILLAGDDSKISFSIYGKDVDMISSLSSGQTQPAAASNKVKTSTVVKYDWENVYYIGHLVAVHRHTIHMAYALKGKNGGIVRIINCKTAERSLVKGFHGKVLDLSFAHQDAVILGAVDQLGNLFIYDIQEDNSGKIDPVLLLQVDRADESLDSEFHRIIWCPYIPEEDESGGNTTADSSLPDDAGRLLVLTHGEMAEMWNVDTVTKEYGSGPLQPEEVEHGYLKMTSHSQPIVDASFSPDGTALATASLDGEVKFFQVYMTDKATPRCLHQWRPHDGKPVSSLYFLDDHKNPSAEVQFWKFAVTGADQNRELKVWSCETWTCLQTVRFLSPPGSLQPPPCIKASLDLSANYLVLSDIHRKVLYVMHIHQDSEKGHTGFSAVSEFLLTQPCMSLAVVDAGRRRFKKSLQESDLMGDITTGEIAEEDEEEVSGNTDGPDVGVYVKVYSVHTRALQELQIRFRQESSSPQPPPVSVSSLSSTGDGLRDGLSDMSMNLDTTGASEPDRGPQTGASGDQSYSSDSHQAEKINDFSHASSAISNHSGSSEPLASRCDDPLLRSDRSAPSELSYQSSDHEETILQTPDAFTSPRRTEASHEVRGTILDSVRSSTSSGFTQVTAMDDAVMMTPHGSVAPSHPSPLSSVTITPSSSVSGSAALDTPTSLPLPPVTPSEEQALATPRSTQKELGETPTGRGFPAAPVITPTSVLPPVSLADTRQEDAEDLFSASTRRAKLQSTGSSSSTSLEISEILEGNKKPEPGLMYDETEEGDEEEEKGDQEDPVETTYAPGKWPPAPAVEEVNKEAQRLATQALQRATEMHMQARGEEDEEGALDEDNNDEDDLDNNVTAPVATSSQISYAGDDDDDDVSKEDFLRYPQKLLRDNNKVYIQDMSALKELQSSISQMMGLLRSQQKEITDLREELYAQRQATDVMQGLQIQLDSLETILENKVTGALTEHSQRTESNLLHKVLQEKESQERQKQERLLHTVSQTMDKTLANRLEKTIQEEVRHTLLPSISGMLQPLGEQLHQEMAQKLTATDSLMKDNIAKLVRSRQTVESIGQAAGNSMLGHINVTCRDVLVPGFDRACQNLFHQVNDTFQKGTHEYVQHLEGHLDQVRRRHEEGRDPVVGQLTSVLDSLRQQGDTATSTLTQLRGLSHSVQTQLEQLSAIQAQHAGMQQQWQHALSSMEDKVLLEVRKIIQEELNSALREQQASLNDSIHVALRSGAVTPIAPITPDPQRQQAEVLSTLRRGQVNLAFQQALSAADLNLVMFVCESVDPTDIFNQQPCPLQQNVLLSLIQQLSAELTSNTTTKHRYLEEAIMNLDSKHPIVREHGPTVLSNLSQKLRLFIQSHPDHKMSRPFKMLLMASQSALNI